MISLLLLLLLSLTPAGFSFLLRGSDLQQPLIFNGEVVTSTDFFYQVAIETSKNKVYCGGAIITNKLILTAAHCVQKDPKTIHIRSNSFIRGRGGTVREVESLHPHEEYDSTIMNNDIAIIVIQPPYYSFHEHFQPVGIALPTMTDIVGARGTVSGWGLTEKLERPSKLLSVDVPIISVEQCFKGLDVYHMAYLLTDNMICAGYDDEKNACRGDSGGPFVLDKVIVGVVSWTPEMNGDLQCDSIAMYTKVSNYFDWIMNIVHKTDSTYPPNVTGSRSLPVRRVQGTDSMYPLNWPGPWSPPFRHRRSVMKHAPLLIERMSRMRRGTKLRTSKDSAFPERRKKVSKRKKKPETRRTLMRQRKQKKDKKKTKRLGRNKKHDG